MNKKIFIGSIIAVAILVLVSFTGVVGYQTTKSHTIARTSPLFNMRISRAIDEESRDLTCDYVGMEEESVLSIPKRDDKTALNRKVLDMIYEMDDIIFNKFMNLVVNKIQKRAELKDVNIYEIINAIHKLRANPDRINLNAYKNSDVTWRYEFVPTLCWFPGCNIIFILSDFIANIWLSILGWITDKKSCHYMTHDACCP